MDFFYSGLIQPMINILVLTYQFLASLSIPYALGFAIIIFTSAIRFAMNPLMGGMIKQQKKMQDIAPQLAKIKEKYKHDARQQQVAQMELFKTQGINPLAGCLPLLLQIPIFIALYQALDKIVKVESVNGLNQFLYTGLPKFTNLWDTTFFGLPLGKSPSELLPTFGFAIILVSIITGLLQFAQSKMMMPSTPPKTQVKADDFSASLQKQMSFMMPLMIGFFSFTFPIGITLYWNTFTIFGIIQQYKLQGWGGLEPTLLTLRKKIWKK